METRSQWSRILLLRMVESDRKRIFCPSGSDDDDDEKKTSSTTDNAATPSGIVDSWSRIAASSKASSNGTTTQGRKSLSGWTKCPLCEGYSNKTFAVGRGLANHLKDVHTPWKPSRMAQKIHRRTFEVSERERKRRRIESNVNGGYAANNIQPLEAFEPTESQVEEWNVRMIEILKQVEQSTALSDQILKSGKNDHIRDKDSVRNVDHVKDERSVAYRDSLPPFLMAAADGDLAALKDAVEQAQKYNEEAVWDLLNTNDRHKSIADHWAAGGGHLECLKYLYQLRKEFDTKNQTGMEQKDASSFTTKTEPTAPSKKLRRRDGKTCLHYAARNGHIDCIRFLLDETTKLHSVDEKSGDGTTPLHLACYGGQYETAKYLIEQHRANVQTTNQWGCSCAHWLAMTISESNVDVRNLCSYLHNNHGLSFIEAQGQGHTALHKAAHRGNRCVIEWMAQSKKQGGAGLSKKETKKAGARDQGGHRPSDIWETMFPADLEFVTWMRNDMGW